VDDDGGGGRETGRDRPARRPLRVFSLDPMRRDQLTATSVLEVPYEPLGLGPTGSRLAVLDFDAVANHFYEPVDLEVPELAVQAGVEPDERDPRFHQQMVYAVAASVLEQFDRALGRRVRFRRGRLKLYPHAFVGPNAFYLSRLNAVAFGYFRATAAAGPHLPGQTVFTCLSHDIVAHEVTHGIVDRLRPYYGQRTNPHVPAFHEAIADIVAVLMHFKLEGVLERAIADTRSELDDTSVLVDLAAQFGYARGDAGALRSALRSPDPGALARALTAHTRGSILLAAVFDAFLAGYRARVAHLLALATGGSGILAAGLLDPRLVAELASVAREVADRILLLCIRAFDYLPPTDVTFGDFLRALVTADHDLFLDDESGLRAAMIESFRRHGIVADGVFSLAERSLCWDEVDPGDFTRVPVDAEYVLSDAAALGAGRWGDEGAEDDSRLDGSTAASRWHTELRAWAEANRGPLGLAPDRIHVDHFHTSFRFDQNRQPQVDVVLQLIQRRTVPLGPESQEVKVTSGVLVVADAAGNVRYVVGKPPAGHGPAGAAVAERLRALLADQGPPTAKGDGRHSDALLLDFAALHVAGAHA
jgi:hypothetical protein